MPRALKSAFAAIFSLLSAAPMYAQDVSANTTARQPGLVLQEFIYDDAPFAQCHASTIEQTPSGLVAAWFGGPREGDKEVGIWLARHDGDAWSQPVEVANGVQPDGTRHPCWNPVLFNAPDGNLLLFYKVGPSPSRWWGEVIASSDDGQTWSKSRRLPEAILGPVKNKPVLAAGGLLCGSSSEHAGWRVHMEWTPDGGRTWQRTGALNDGDEFAAIQPTILRYGDRLQILCRSRQQAIVESWSDDGGRTWDPLEKTPLPNPNSGIDAVTLSDGRALLVYNHTQRGRSPLNVALSKDGRRWHAAMVLESQPGEYSYPAVIQSKDGTIHVTYTWNRRRVKHVAINPEELELRAIRDAAWPGEAERQ